MFLEDESLASISSIKKDNPYVKREIDERVSFGSYDR